MNDRERLEKAMDALLTAADEIAALTDASNYTKLLATLEHLQDELRGEYVSRFQSESE